MYPSHPAQRWLRGYQTITARVAVLNSGAATTTCYVTGFARPPGAGGDGFPFSPERLAVTVNPGQTNIVDLTWTPDSGITTGACYFTCRLYKTSSVPTPGTPTASPPPSWSSIRTAWRCRAYPSTALPSLVDSRPSPPASPS